MAAGTRPIPDRGPSAVYTTGQLAWTLLRTGLPRDHPALAKAWRYLLAQQQDFGGWFQTTTHENFRTPMRETRYAVMALAEAFPRPEAPLRGWGNRVNGPARLPRTDSLVNTLDDLENLWDVPEADRARFAQAIAKLLDCPEPQVRARPRPRWAGWGSPSRPSRWRRGSQTRPRSYGARPPGPCVGSETTESAWTLSSERSMTRIPAFAAGRLEFSPINSTEWMSEGTWQID